MAPSSSTTFSLSTAVPRPCERRTDERHPADAAGRQAGRREQRAANPGAQYFGRRPVGKSSHAATAIGEQVSVELSSQKIPSTVVWIREGTVGLKFDQNVDLGELLAGRKPRHGFRPRPPRLEVSCKASIRVGKVYYTVDVHDISLGGMKVEPIEEYCVGKSVDRRRRELAADQGRSALVLRPPRRHRVRTRARVPGALRMGRQTARNGQPESQQPAAAKTPWRLAPFNDCRRRTILPAPVKERVDG